MESTSTKLKKKINENKPKAVTAGIKIEILDLLLKNAPSALALETVMSVIRFQDN